MNCPLYEMCREILVETSVDIQATKILLGISVCEYYRLRECTPLLM